MTPTMILTDVPTLAHPAAYAVVDGFSLGIAFALWCVLLCFALRSFGRVWWYYARSQHVSPWRFIRSDS
jgi:hypothetical protein